MKAARFALLLLLLSTLAFTATIPKQTSGIEILESNHYSSTDSYKGTFPISHAVTGNSLAFVLRKKANPKYSIEKDHLLVSFAAPNATTSCKIKDYDSLCVFEDVVDAQVELTIQCASLPCEASWIIYQLPLAPLKQGQLTSGLYSLQQSSDHLVAYIKCNDPEIAHFADDVSLFSTSKFQRSVADNRIYYLFANEEKGFVFIDIKEKSQTCAQLTILSVPKELQYSENRMKDFTNKHSSSIFRLKKPKKDFRLDCYLTRLDEADLESEAKVRLGEIKGNSTTTLSQYRIRPMGNGKIIEFSITFKQPKGDYDALQLQITGGEEKISVITLVVNEAAEQQVQLFERNYFSLKKGQRISYKFLPSQSAQEDEQGYFIPAIDANITMNATNCSAKTGCNFYLQAEENVQSYIFLSNKPDQAIQGEITYNPLVKSAKTKIKEGQTIYFRKIMKAHNAFEIAVNSPNIVLYAASKDKCSTPSSTCNERSGNYHHPFAYNPKEDGDFIIAALSLDSGQFLITVIEESDEFIHLEDGVAFSYRIEETEQELLFKYQLKKKMDVTFNLVAPLNHLALNVFNGESDISDMESVTSSQGYITFIKEEISSLNFIIQVKKTELTLGKLTHFTLIATTSQSVVRLDSTVAHYQNMKPTAIRQYIFEFDPSQQFILSFYTHNLKGKTINIMLSLSNNRVWNDMNLEKIFIDQQSDHLDLKKFSAELCEKQGETSCEIFLLLKNQMQIEVDITITLLTRNSIIQLKDGLWHSYLENTIASGAYFYFYPKHIDKNIVIIYSTAMEDLRLSYTLWKTDTKSLNPTTWPFPKVTESQDLATPSTVNHITIDKQYLVQQCWPNCIVLLTLYRDPKIAFKSVSQSADFKIMASNNQIQLPEKTRISLSLKKDEDKELIVDLKYAINQEYLTFYTSHSIGHFSLYANIISSKNMRCPIVPVDVDFNIKHGESTIDVSLIKFKARQHNMQEDGNLYLCILAQGNEDGKFSIEYISGEQSVQLLHVNSFQKIKLDTNETRIYQIQGEHDFVAKIMRRSGYPYVFINKCSTDRVKECEDEIVSSKEMGKQLIHKNQQFHEQPCVECIYLLKFQTLEPSVINLHLNTINAETELLQHELITDFISSREESRYSITHVQNKDLFINIHVIEGDISVKLTNLNQISLIKESAPNKKTLHFYIPKSYSIQSSKSTAGNPFFGSFEFSSTFSSFHLIIRSKTPNVTSTYSIFYSSGDNQVYLQDGLITDVALEPNVPFKFYYENDISNSHIYFTLSAFDEMILNSLNITSFYYQSQAQSEEESKVEFRMSLPTIRKKTPSPTLLLSLPEKNYFQIQLVNPNPKPQVVSLGINHQQLIILPTGHEFPFSLHPNEEVNFLVEVSSVGFIGIQIRNCDESDPTFSYAFDYLTFMKGEFESQIDLLEEDPKFQEFIKIVKPGTLYLNIKAKTTSSLLAIYAQLFPERPKKQLIKAGNRGIIEYQFTQAKIADLFIAPVLCETNCRGVKYYSMSAQKLSDLQSQLVCPSSFFSIDSLYSSDAIPLKPIRYDQDSKVIKFSYSLPHHTSYVAVKAVIQGQQIFYRPVQVVTLWGHLSKTSQSYKLTIASILIVSICALLLFVRHNARRGYRRIDSSGDSSSSTDNLHV